MSRRKAVRPHFEALESFVNKEYYFVRDATWGWLNDDSIFVIAQNGPDVFTMDPWPQLVFIMANGQFTVSGLIYELADSYEEEIPTLLDACVIEELTKLIDRGLIKFISQPGQPSEFALNPIPNSK